jgi:hypothetical protein
MSKLLSSCFITILTSVVTVFPSTLSPSQSGQQAPESKRSLRILIEGDAAALPTIIAELRKGADKYDLDLEFVSDPVAGHDARIVVAKGNGKLWCSSHSPGNTEAPSILVYYFAAASVFDGAGHLAFTATGSGEFGKFATSGLAQRLLKRLAGSYAKLHGSRSPSHTTTQTPKPEPAP